MVLQLNGGGVRPDAMYKPFEVVSGASHLVEEPDKLGEVARLTVDWFERRLFGAA